jgi:DNA-binding transcriptional LysR family regulator
VEAGLSTPLYARLLNGDLDLVLSAPEEGVVIDARLGRTFLLEEKDALVVGANHPLLVRDGITLADLLDFPWIVPRRSTRLDRIHAVFAANRLPPPPYVLRSESSELARGLLTQEPFICLIGEGVLRSEISAGLLAILPDLGFASSRPAFLSSRRGSHLRPAARNFALVLQEVAAGA